MRNSLPICLSGSLLLSCLLTPIKTFAITPLQSHEIPLSDGLLTLQSGSHPLTAATAKYRRVPEAHSPSGVAQGIRQQKIRQITSIGRGKTFDSAAQNAAKNALTEVVGSFLDSETLVTKKAVISNGLNERTKQIRIDIREYSQGSIYSMDIIDSYIESGVSVVIAKVSVRVDDFRRYVQDLASGSVDLSGGLFASISSNFKNKSKSMDILSEKIKSVAQGKVISIDMGKPISLDQFYVSSYCKYPIDDDCEGARNNFGGLNEATSIVLPVTISLLPGFEQNLMSTLDNIASDKIITDSSSLYIGLSGHDVAEFINRKTRKVWDPENSKDVQVAVIKPNPLPAILYYFPGLKTIVKTKYPGMLHPLTNLYSEYSLRCPDSRCADYFFHSYAVNFRDETGSSIYSFELKPSELHSWDRKLRFVNRGYVDFSSNGMSGIGLVTGDSGQVVFVTERKFWLGIEAPLEVLQKSHSISIDYLDR